MDTAKPTDSVVDSPSKEQLSSTTSARAAVTKPAGDIIGAVNPQNPAERDNDEKEKEDTAETRKDKTSARQSLASRLSRESQQNNSFRNSGNDFYSSLFDLAHLNPYYYNYMSYAYSPQARLAASNATLQLAMENYWAQMATTNSYFTPNFAANYYSSTPNYQPTKMQQQRVTINLHSSLQKDTKSRPSQSEDLGNATTLMLRNIPNRYTRDMLLKEFENHGVMKGIDFFYLPMDIRYKCNVGYCFVNMASAKAVRKFVREFDNTKLDQVQSEKICQLSRAKVQGKEANIEQYRNSAVVTMSEEFQPMIFKNGRSLPFPKPTEDGARARESRNTRSSKATHSSNDRAGRSKKQNNKQEFQPPERTSKKGGKKGKKIDQKEQAKEPTKKTGKKGQSSRESDRTDKKEQSPRKGKKAQSPKEEGEDSPKAKESAKKSEKKEPSPKKNDKKEPSVTKNEESEPSPKKSEKKEQSPKKEDEAKNAKIKRTSAPKEKVDASAPKKSRSSKKSNDKDTQASRDETSLKK